jgi:hypothetical protein
MTTDQIIIALGIGFVAVGFGLIVQALMMHGYHRRLDRIERERKAPDGRPQ